MYMDDIHAIMKTRKVIAFRDLFSEPNENVQFTRVAEEDNEWFITILGTM